MTENHSSILFAWTVFCDDDWQDRRHTRETRGNRVRETRASRRHWGWRLPHHRQASWRRGRGSFVGGSWLNRSKRGRLRWMGPTRRSFIFIILFGLYAKRTIWYYLTRTRAWSESIIKTHWNLLFEPDRWNLTLWTVWKHVASNETPVGSGNWPFAMSHTCACMSSRTVRCFVRRGTIAATWIVLRIQFLRSKIS